MKLNFGSGKDRIDGFKNVDVLPWDGNTDIFCDMKKIPYPFEDNSIEEIRSVENLEHLSFRLTEQVLAEFYRILQPGGRLYIQVPDAGLAMEYYVNDQVCDCVPHKDPTGKFAASPTCFNCNGRGKINPRRWLFTFTGAQKHPFDAHLAIFTKDNLKQLLRNNGFANISFTDDNYKIKVNCYKP